MDIRKGQASGASSADERRSTRSAVLLSAAIEWCGDWIPVRVINLSSHGVLIQGDGLPAAESQVIFRCNDVAVPGWMAWLRPPHAGVSFDERINLRTLRVRSGGAAGMVIRDDRDVDFRRPGFRGNQMSAAERAVVEKWIKDQEPE